MIYNNCGVLVFLMVCWLGLKDFFVKSICSSLNNAGILFLVHLELTVLTSNRNLKIFTVMKDIFISGKDVLCFRIMKKRK